MKKKYRFLDLDREHQLEILGNLSNDKAAKKSMWVFVSDYPVELATAIAWDTSVTIVDEHVESLVFMIDHKGKVRRPILIDDLNEDSVWMEGRHRSIASEELGFKTIPAFVRVK